MKKDTRVLLRSLNECEDNQLIFKPKESIRAGYEK